MKWTVRPLRKKWVVERGGEIAGTLRSEHVAQQVARLLNSEQAQ